jgi:3-oxoacyl-[acyl-carrier-protein] synthase-3
MSSDVFINRTAVHMPHRAIGNDDMERVLGVVGDKPSRTRKMILRNNGIKSRYYVLDPRTGRPTITNARLAAMAIEKLFDDRFAMDQVDCLVAATSIPDQVAPGHGVMVHGELGNPPCEVISTTGICACGVAALKYGFMALKTGEHQQVVVSASETASLFLRAEMLSGVEEASEERLAAHPEMSFDRDFLRWMLSDGAGAFALGRRPLAGERSLRLDWIDIISFANQIETCMYFGAVKETDGDDKGRLKGWANQALTRENAPLFMSIKQDVKLLNDHAVRLTVEEALGRVIAKRRLRPGDYSYFLPHYSSHYFRDRLHGAMERIGFSIPYEKWFTNLYTKGNTGAASIFIMLHELIETRALHSGEKILCFVPESGRFTGCYFQLTVV